jgi:DNA modification methylase
MAKKSSKAQGEKLFEETFVPGAAGSGKLFDVNYEASIGQPVECLGKTFPNDAARRAFYIGKLRSKLRDPEFRAIPGFPHGDDESILALSDPPYYTACPNPFLEEVVESHRTAIKGMPEAFQTDPFCLDVSAGKSDPAYNVHAYPTKVPPDAIAPLVSHYTNQHSVVLDPFSGTGMTGVASQRQGKELLIFLNDLSPLAAHISNAMTLSALPGDFISAASRILEMVQAEFGWMYRSAFEREERIVRYFVWSDVYLCDSCGEPVRIYDIETSDSQGGLKKKTPCPKCKSLISKATMEPLHENYWDHVLNENVKRIKCEPVLKVTVNSNRSTKMPVTSADVQLLQRINSQAASFTIPTSKMLFRDGCWGDQWRSSYHQGVTHSHQFYTYRNLWILGAIWEQIQATSIFPIRRALEFWFTASLSRLTRLNRYMAQHNRHVGPLSGTLFINPIQAEISPFYFLEDKKDEVGAFLGSLQSTQQKRVFVGTGSSQKLGLPDQSVDYIFTDPPFGDNLMYSELNFLSEAWLKVFTNQSPEAIVSKSQQKGISSFQEMIEKVFVECYRVLKPGRWLTMEFHNSRNAVWTAIQEAIGHAGFVVADVRTLDKEKGTTKQLSQAGTVKQDLIISAYKPDIALEEKFKVTAGTEEGAWEFIRSHLKHLPVFVQKDGRSENISERHGYLLFDRMVAFHVQRTYSVPLSASEFYAGLRQRFPERESMYFLPDQVSEFDRKRLDVKESEQFELFVSDEKSAIQWVRAQLKRNPQSFKDIQPSFMKEAQQVWEKHEQPVELKTILEQNFVQDSDGSWRVPDSKKESDLEQLRTRALMKEFQQYIDTKGRLKIVRTEALRTGFKECWQKKDYMTIVQMARRIPDTVIQEDPALLMYFDNASLLLGD